MDIPAHSVGTPVVNPSQNTKLNDERKVEDDSEIERSEAESLAASDGEKAVDEEREESHTRESDLQNGIGGTLNIEV